MTDERAKRRTYELLEREAGEARLDFASDLFITTLIVVNVSAVMPETVAWIEAPLRPSFVGLQLFSVAVFTMEYVLRLWSFSYA